MRNIILKMSIVISLTPVLAFTDLQNKLESVGTDILKGNP